MIYVINMVKKMSDIQILVGERIRMLAEKIDLSITFLAYDSNIDRSHISKIINGHVNVSMESLEIICTALGVSVSEFFNDGVFEKNNNTEK